jgi:hypothetical protein
MSRASGGSGALNDSQSLLDSPNQIETQQEPKEKQIESKGRKKPGVTGVKIRKSA